MRAYAWASTTVWQQGPQTPEETALRLHCFDYAASMAGAPEQLSPMIRANVEKVPLLAARWGLDLASVQAHFLLDEHGVAGKAAHWH